MLDSIDNFLDSICDEILEKTIENYLKIVSKLFIFESMDIFKYQRIFEIFTKMKDVEFNKYVQCNEKLSKKGNITFPNIDNVSLLDIDILNGQTIYLRVKFLVSFGIYSSILRVDWDYKLNLLKNRVTRLVMEKCFA